jgi:hypothetical protein
MYLKTCFQQEDNIIGCLVAWLIAASPAFKPVVVAASDLDNLASLFLNVVARMIHSDQSSTLLAGVQIFTPVSVTVV